MSKDSKIHTTYTTKDILEYSKSHTFSKKNLLRLTLAKKQAFKELYHNGMHQIQQWHKTLHDMDKEFSEQSSTHHNFDNNQNMSKVCQTKKPIT